MVLLTLALDTLLFNLQPIETQLASGTLILTPNNRLKNKLLLRWGQTQNQQCTWPTQQVMSLMEWVNSQWGQLQQTHHADYLRIIATPIVRRNLWNDVIHSSDTTHPLIHPRLMIDQLDQAYNYLKMWQVDTQEWRNSGSAEQQLRLETWFRQFEQQIDMLGLISEESMLETLLSAALGTQQPKTDRVCLLNFDTLAPLHQTLLEANFDSIDAVNSNTTPATQAYRVECKDPAHELVCAARWARETLHNNPHQTVAIIDPNLGKNRARLERALAREFEPSHHLPSSQRYTMPFNFSAGIPLALCPLIYDALETLRWNQPKSPEQTCQWLNSPFIGAADDTPLRSWLMSRIIASQKTEISLLNLKRHVDTAQVQVPFAESNIGSIWSNGLETMLHWPSSSTGKRWASLLLKTLTAFNWPGARTLDSEEHQQAKQFLALLEQLSQADWLNKPLSRSDAINWIGELANKQPFQPQTPESALQVLGTLESAGLQFDHIWVLGMDDTQWPPAPSPNPLLPAKLQRDLSMPHASAERELAFCQSITRNYLHAAQRVFFSYAQRDGDRDLTLSPLIAELPLFSVETVEPSPFSPAHFQWLQTQQAPHVDALELTRLRGGSGMLQKQSRCPLAAFMELRLSAVRPDRAQPGLSALERGNILHQALFYFWQHRNDLSQISQDTLNDDLARAIETACKEVKHLQNTRYLDLERLRLQRLLLAWLEYERARPAFCIQGLEQSVEFRLGGLPLRLRLDRIDKIDQQWLLIDYKSGTSDPKKWLGERPEEPQLPLYAVALSDQHQPVAAIAFAELRQKNQTLSGFGEIQLSEGIQIPGSRNLPFDSWGQLLDHWRRVLLNLAEELLCGTTPLVFSSVQTQSYLAHLNTLLREAEQVDLADARAAQGVIQ